jgi:hypothetical protein
LYIQEEGGALTDTKSCGQNTIAFLQFILSQIIVDYNSKIFKKIII